MNSSSSSAEIGFPGLLTIVFVIMKMTHFIDWSWWWVLAPLWIGFAIAIVIIVIGSLIVALLDHHV